MKSVLQVLVVVFIFSFEFTSAKTHLANFVPLCDAKATKTNLHACVVNSANSFIPILAKGVKELDFPPLDPLRIHEMIIDQSNAPISLRLKLMDTIHTGLSTMEFHSASIDTRKHRWVLNATLHDYTLYGRYKGNGRIILLPIVGEGYANFTLTNTKVDFVLQGHPEKKENDAIVHNLSNLRVFFGFDKCFVSMTNLFGGNKPLSENLNTFLGSNSREVFEGLKVSLEKVYSAIYLNLIRRLVSNQPYTELFKNGL